LVKDFIFVKYSKNLTTRLDKKGLSTILKKHTELFAKSENKFLKGISPNFRKEIIFNLENYKDDLLKLGLTTGLMAKALQNGFTAESEKPIVLQGLLVSRDNKIVFGLRNKPKFREKLPDEKNDFKIMLCPAGYATFNKDGSLIKPFYKELEEELGLREKDIDKIEIFGHNNDIGFTEGIRLTYIVFANLEFNEIKKRWKKADHSWEYIELIEIDFQEKTLADMIEAKDLSKYSKKARGIVYSSVEPPIIYIIKSNYFKKF